MEKKDLRIVFLGTPDFAVETLESIISAGYNVVGVVTMPDKPAGRGHKMFQSPVKLCAMAHGIEVLQPVKLKDPDFLSRLKALEADLFIVIAFRMLPEAVWAMPRLGTFNLHASLLPRYRGAAPINRAIMNGDTETGVTTFFLSHDIDTGDIISQERVEILPEDNVGTLHDKLMHLGSRLTLQTIADILNDSVSPVPQDKLLAGAEATQAPKIFKEDCLIDWNRPASDIHNQVRGLSPYPGAWTAIADDSGNRSQLKIFETRLDPASAPALAPGSIDISGGRFFAGTADGTIEILSLQPQGKRRMPAADFLRGLRSAISICQPD